MSDTLTNGPIAKIRANLSHIKTCLENIGIEAGALDDTELGRIMMAHLKQSFHRHQLMLDEIERIESEAKCKSTST